MTTFWQMMKKNLCFKKIKEKKLKRKKYAEKTKELRRQAKKAKNDKLEKILWGRSTELNTEFANIKEIKKKNRKN